MAYAQWLIPSKTQGSGSTLRCKDRSMKVAVTVIQATGRIILKSSQGHVLRSFNGNRLTTLPATA